jgi:peptidase MA superfamily protein
VIRRLGRVAAATVLVLSSLGIGVGGALAADPVTFGAPRAISTYGKSIVFDQPVVLAAAPRRVELLTRSPGSAGPSVTEIEAPGSGDRTLHFELDLAKGHIVPNTKFVASWRVTDANGRAWLGPAKTLTYADDSVKWSSLDGNIVRVHWYEGGDAFGKRALAIGDKAVADTASLLGVTETEPIDFYIYADSDKFRAALGPGTRENVGGQAHADIRTMFALITPAEIDATWVDVVVPHELTHLVFATATDNPFHEPPHWLNEGLAVYLSEGYALDYRASVEQVVGDGTIIPLEGLAGAFPTTFERFHLGYAESVSVVDYIVRTNGRDALVAMIRSYATGVTDDEAFKAALGVDVAGFEANWLASLGAGAPVRFGPQPAPAGPVPDGWSGTAPNPSIGPGTGSSPAPGTNRPPTDSPGANSATGPILVALVLAAVIGGGLVLLVVSRRGPRSAPPGP